LKKEHNNGGAAPPSSGLAMVLIAAPCWEPLPDGFVECAVKGFYLIWKTGYENNLISKQDDLF
jgi:hypothetical protein